MQFPLAYLPFQASIDCYWICLPELVSHWICREIYPSDWWYDTQDQLPARVTIVPIIYISDKAYSINLLCHQHAWPLDLTHGYMRKGICWTLKSHSRILICLITCCLQDTKHTNEVWHYGVETVLSPVRNQHIPGPSKKWDCADGFLRLCYPLLAAWVGNYPEQVMFVQVTNGSYLMCDLPKGLLLGHSTFWPRDNSKDQHVYLDFLDNTNIDALPTLGIHPICNQFWQFPLCNINQLWQSDEFRQLLLEFVLDLLNWLPPYLNHTNVKAQFDNQFTLVLW